MFKPLLAQLPNLLQDAKDNQIYRIEREIPPLDILTWLASQKSYGKGYWSNRDNSFKLAGLGRAISLQGDNINIIDTIQPMLKTAPNARFLGGLSFFGEHSAPQGLGAVSFILPRFEIINRNNKYFAAINISSRDTIKDFNELELPLNIDNNIWDKSNIKIDSIVHNPNKEDWLSIIDKALNEFISTDLQKVVPARCTTITCNDNVDSLAVLRKVLTEGTTAFCFSPGNGETFIGVSPENLFAVNGTMLKTEALAGTASISVDSKYLLNSVKDQHEHKFVVDALSETLKEISNQIEVLPQKILKLSKVQHLLTSVKAVLNKKIPLAELIKLLHPTPALGGTPRNLALKFISNHEDFKRGWFAAPVGWISASEAEFTVAIRSALIQSNKIKLYAGAGIVKESIAENEWQELNYKISQYLDVFDKE